ncbi:hypothetical protein [uncultured Adlercreutzia sp.]|uniref:hypothetical protein n=1 Tax=uncultured Adlercreutzia sp. TaxID=875803 RepID=UPI00258C6E67|nr:hypothetical protein [uncultured Adlercreutzia sp.]
MSDNYLVPLEESELIDLDELMEQPIEVLKICAVRKNTPPMVLAKLACHRNNTLREEVARNTATPSDILAMLSGDPDDDVVRAVASNPSTEVDVLKRIIENGGSGHVAALKNENAPLESILFYMMGRLGSEERVSLNFNQRFNKLIRLASQIDMKKNAARPADNGIEFDVAEYECDDMGDVEGY